ncbi:MAG TPA: hypothetical protein VFS47_02770 [Steroidobacteraceae bacterium]|nr:hypothetical protein [Steroidobacteraceae bacterium]
MSAGARAVSSFEIEDVFVIQSNCSIPRDFNQIEPRNDGLFAHTVSADPECLWQVRTTPDGASLYVLRYFVNAVARLMKPGFEPTEEPPTDEDSLAVLQFKLAVDYRCPADAVEDQEAIGAFSKNVCFHAWPFIREEIHSACARLRLPRLTLPMLKPDTKSLPEQSSDAAQDGGQGPTETV